MNAVPRRNTEVLNDLVALTERVLNASPAGDWIAEIERVSHDIERAEKRPADAQRTVGDAEKMLLTALRHVCAIEHKMTPRNDKWRLAAAALLDLARDDLFTAMKQERGVPAC